MTLWKTQIQGALPYLPATTPWMVTDDSATGVDRMMRCLQMQNTRQCHYFTRLNAHPTSCMEDGMSS